MRVTIQIETRRRGKPYQPIIEHKHAGTGIVVYADKEVLLLKALGGLWRFSFRAPCMHTPTRFYLNDPPPKSFLVSMEPTSWGWDRKSAGFKNLVATGLAKPDRYGEARPVGRFRLAPRSHELLWAAVLAEGYIVSKAKKPRRPGKTLSCSKRKQSRPARRTRGA